MSDPHVERWKQRGRVAVWKTKGRHPAWNLAADEVACDALVDLLDRMEQGKYPSQKTIILAKPERTADGFPRRPATFAKRLTLKYRKSYVPDDFWSLEGAAAEFQFVLGLSWLRKLRDAVLDIKAGGGDYTIGPDDARLWIWWYVDW